jgi:hypothetical protein
MKNNNESLEVKNILFGEIEFKKTLEEIVKSDRDNDESERISISRCPALIKSTFWFLKSKDEHLRTEAKTTRCLTKAGLQILQNIPGLSSIREQRRRVHLEGNDLERLYWMNQDYSISNRLLVCGVKSTCYLFKRVLGALSNIASDLGIPTSTVVTLTLLAGMGTSEKWVPKRDKDRALAEIKRFVEWVKKRAASNECG